MTAPYTAAALVPGLDPGADVASPLILALPKGRILAECGALLARAGVNPAPDYADEDSRRLRFPTDDPRLDVVRVRPFDVATFVAFGAAQLGICGADVLMEFDYSEIYAPLDLDIGHCHIAVAATIDWVAHEDGRQPSHIRVATKYPEITRRHFAARGIQAECIKLNGAIELAPRLGLCRHIVDLVQTGATLKANELVEIERIAEVSSRLIVNRPALKTRPEEIGRWIERFRAGVGETRFSTGAGASSAVLRALPSPAAREGQGAQRGSGGKGERPPGAARARR